MLRSAQTSRWAIALLLAGPLAWLSAPAVAQVRYLATFGNDSRPCTTVAAPCRTLPRAIAVTPPGGEVRLLDSGLFGNATIAKSLTVSSDGATIVSTITINGSDAVVVLRGLNLRGATSMPDGVRVVAASAIHIEHCTVSKFATHGIYADAAGAKIFVTDSILRDNAVSGLALEDPSASPPDNFGTMTLTVVNSRIENNGADGALIIGGSSTFVRTIVTNNRANGINLNFGKAAIVSTTASMNGEAGYDLSGSIAVLESSAAQNNKNGLVAGGSSAAVVIISNSTFTDNTSVGIKTNGAVQTRENNTVVNNGTDFQGTPTPLAGQ